MIETDALLKQIAELRKKYTFESDKEQCFLWEKQVREAIKNRDLLQADGIKKLIVELKNIINDISLLLAWDRNSQDKEQRLVLFAKRDAYVWLCEFFTGKEEILKGIKNAVERELQ